MKIQATCMLVGVMLAGSVAYAAPPIKGARNIVLVHGAFADGSGWQDVAAQLEKDGYTVSAVQLPETSLADDVKATQRILASQDGPTVLAAHSYGGTVISEAGNDPKAVSLVYIAAFQPDSGENTMTLIEKIPAASAGIKATPDGFLYFDPETYAIDFAGDLPKPKAEFMARSQVLPAAAAFSTPITTAAWRTKPSWAVVAVHDHAINPELERWMTKRANSHTTEINASHTVYISHPVEVAKVIEQAAVGATH